MRTGNALLPFVLLALAISCGGRKIQTPDDPNNQNKPPAPTSGLSGTIEFVRPATDFKQLAQDNLEAEWAEGEVLVIRQEGISDQEARKEIERTGGNLLQQTEGATSYYRIQKPDLRKNWEDRVGQALKEWTETGDFTEETRAAFKQIREQSNQFVQKFREKKSFFSRVAPNYIRQWTPISAENPDQWAVSETGLPKVWEKYGHGSRAVIVAVVDTGARKSHPNLSGALLWDQGYDFVNNEMDGDETSGPDPNPEEPVSSYSSFHGTHVAGIVAATPSGDLDVTGVAGGVSILPVRVLGEDGGTDFDVAQGILYAAGLLNVKVEGKQRPERRADVINLSLGGPGESPVLRDAIQRATAAGVVVIVAAGNEGTSVPSYPAAYSEVIAVGAYGAGGEYALFSNFGANVDIMAPGVNILSSWVRYPGIDKMTFMSGTSMASPFVAGLVALMKSVTPGLTLPDLRKLLYQNAGATHLQNCLSLQNVNRCGRGALDLPALLDAAQASPPSNVKIELAQDWVVGTPEQSVVTLVLPNTGTGDLAVLNQDALFPEGTRPDWLKEVTATPESRGIRLTFTFDPSKLGSQPVAATMDLLTNAAEIRVIGKNGGKPSFSGVLTITIGYEPTDLLHVVLLKAADRTPLAWSHTSQSEAWAYHFDPPAPGEYLILAGQDDDQDGAICSAGDACGAYPSLSSPKKVTLTGKDLIKNLNFKVSRNESSEFKIPLPTESAKGATQ